MRPPKVSKRCWRAVGGGSFFGHRSSFFATRRTLSRASRAPRVLLCAPLRFLPVARARGPSSLAASQKWEHARATVCLLRADARQGGGRGSTDTRSCSPRSAGGFFFCGFFFSIFGKLTGPDTALDAQLKLEHKRLSKEIKLLLLGAGESGKSTIAKQMKILHLNGFTKAELMGFKPVLHSNAIEVIQTLIHGAAELGIAVDEKDRPLLNKIEELSSIETPLDPQLASMLKQAWKLPSMQEVYGRRSDLQLPSSADYVMENVDRYAASDFIPNAEDVLRCRARTTGIHEIEFDIDSMHFR